MHRKTYGSNGDKFADYVEPDVCLGRYDAAKKRTREGLCQLDEHEAKIDALRSAIDAGDHSGPTEGFDFETYIASKRPGDTA